MTALTLSRPERGPNTVLIVGLGLLAWALLNLAVALLSGGYLPFDRPRMVGQPFAVQLAGPTLGLIEQIALMGLVWQLTRRRAAVDMAARAPERSQALRETLGVLAYAALGQAGGWFVGPAFGYRPFSFHLAGSMVGCSKLATPGEAFVWATYNFIVFAVIPYLWFRRRYTATDLNLVSTDRRGDAWVIAVVLAIESAVTLAAYPGLLTLRPAALALAAPLAFFLFLLGTVLPTMVLIFAILLPRYLRLTGSAAITVILGGVTYAAMHLVEGWSSFTSPRTATLSVLFALLSYIGPGMFKSYITLRTRNAWTHALAYHAITPHVVVDTPLIAKVFGIV